MSTSTAVPHVQLFTVALRDGLFDIDTRQAVFEDYATVLRLHQRCSVETLYHRYCRPLRIVPRDKWRQWTTSPRGLVLLSGPRDPAGDIIAMTTVLPELSSPGTADLAVLVEDAYQRQGLCRALVPHAVNQARALGYRRLTAYGLVSSTGWWSVVRRLPGAEVSRADDGTRSLCLDLMSLDEGGLAA